MNYGIAISASGLLTSLYRTDALANNLANLNTTGFKPDMVFTRLRDPVRQEDGVMSLPSNRMLERLGAGLQIAPNRVNFSQGALETTNNTLDLAIEGDGFFVVRAAADAATDKVMLTRDGRMDLDANGRLVNASTGLPVLDSVNLPITIAPTGRIEISSDGTIRQEGQLVARLQLVDVTDRTQLEKQGNSMFAPSAAAYAGQRPAEGRVHQGHLETSAVSPIRAMMETTRAAGSVSSHVRMIDMQDKLLDRAINTFGRTA